MKKIYKTIFTLPNLLTLYRLMLAPLLSLSLLQDRRDVCLLVFLLSGMSDLLDGFLARTLGQVSNLGKVIDPVADKLTYFFILLGLCQSTPAMNVLLIFLIIKESICSITSLFSIRICEHIHGARWHGKISALVLYLTVFCALIPSHPSSLILPVLLPISLALMTLSCTLYVIEHVRAIRHAGGRTMTDLINK